MMRIALILFLAASANAAPQLSALISNDIAPHTASLVGVPHKSDLNAALFTACDLDRTHWIHWLLTNGANPNVSRAMGSFGSTPLAIAANRKSREAVDLLIRFGATNSWRQIHVAAILNNTNKLAALIEQGVNVNDKDPDYGWTAETYAFHFKSAEALTLLIRAGSLHPFTRLQVSIIGNDLSEVAVVAKDCQELRSRSAEIPYTALMLAAFFNRPGACRILIENGAEVEAQTDRGTALMLAVQERSAAALRELLKAGADPNHIMSGCYSPLTYALEQGFGGHHIASGCWSESRPWAGPRIQCQGLCEDRISCHPKTAD